VIQLPNHQALNLYRENYQPSERWPQPHAMVCVNVVAADSDRDAHFLFTSMQQQFINLRRSSPGPLPPPVENIHALWTAGEQYGVEQALRMSIIGSESTVRHGLQTLLRETDADEIMVNGQIFDHKARLDSFEIVAGVKDDLMRG
jgi:alkanesulfonate monooxygenase SsuD/methylene tetrahydromethanopterin reductase-like flavin-dependent oxidoreductase (luciferase family)